MKNSADRFWEKVDRSGECWVWTGSRHPHGYGSCSRMEGETRAHRAAWVLSHGPIPNGLFVLHRCDNPPCVNPEHLFLGTQRDNNNDKVAKGRASGGSSPGERNPSARITATCAAVIRDAIARGIPHRTVAAVFGISKSQVTRIANAKSWASEYATPVKDIPRSHPLRQRLRQVRPPNAPEAA